MNKQDMQIAGLKKVDVVDLWNELSSEKKATLPPSNWSKSPFKRWRYKHDHLSALLLRYNL